jgi:hypothetical protein
MTAYRITRDIDKREQPWMEIRAGEIVYAYTGCTYGCIGAGLAVSRRRGEMPFFEVAKDAIEPIRGRGLLDELSGKLRAHARRAPWVSVGKQSTKMRSAATRNEAR